MAKFIGGMLRRIPRRVGAYTMAMAAGGAENWSKSCVWGAPHLLGTGCSAVLFAGIQVYGGH